MNTFLPTIVLLGRTGKRTLDRRATRPASLCLGHEVLMMRFKSLFLSAAVVFGTAISPLSAQTAAETTGRLTVELNKFEEEDGGGCRAFFLFRNQTDITLEAFEMSLAILDTDGIIDRLLSIEAAPISAARTTLKLFEIPQIQCSDISEVLLHELASCKPQNADEIDCFPFLDLVSRTSARLVK